MGSLVRRITPITIASSGRTDQVKAQIPPRLREIEPASVRPIASAVTVAVVENETNIFPSLRRHNYKEKSAAPRTRELNN